MVIPEPLTVAVRKAQDTILICPPVISQIAAVGALAAGLDFCRPHIERMARVRQGVLEELEAVRGFCTIPAGPGCVLFPAARRYAAGFDDRRRATDPRIRRRRHPRHDFWHGAGLLLAGGIWGAGRGYYQRGNRPAGSRTEFDRTRLTFMQIVACQLDIAWEDKAASHQRVRAMLADTAIEPGALVVLPEMFATGFSMHVDTIAEAPGGPTHEFLGRPAREHRACVLGGLVTRGADGRGRNEAVAFGPQGQELARYCKMQPFSFAGETKHYESGAGITTFRWQDFTVAPMVCYDLRFPELFRIAVRSGAATDGRRRQLAPAPRVALAGTVAGPGHRKPVLRGWGEPRRQRSARPVRRPQPDRRPAGRNRGRGRCRTRKSSWPRSTWRPWSSTASSFRPWPTCGPSCSRASNFLVCPKKDDDWGEFARRSFFRSAGVTKLF